MSENEVERNIGIRSWGTHVILTRLDFIYFMTNLEKASFKLYGLFSFMTLITYYDCGETLVRSILMK